MRILHLSEPSHGWINITFGLKPLTYTFTASVVPNDCLRDLAAATSRLLRGSVDEEVEFSLEPGFTICQLHRNSDSVQIHLELPNQAAPTFEAAFPLAAFAKRLRFELLRIEPRYSDEAGWARPFPHNEIANLG